MQTRDFNTIDPAQQTIQLAADVAVWPVHERGAVVYRLEIPSLHKFFRVGYEEYVLISLLDGKTTISQACGLAAAQLKQRAPTTQQAESIVRWLLQNELAHASDDAAPVRLPDGSRHDSADGMGRLFSKFNPFWIKVPLCRRQRAAHVTWVDAVARPLSVLFSAVAVLIGCTLIALGVISLTANWGEFLQASSSIVSINNGLWLFATWVALKIVHELGHAAACHRVGGTVSEAGIVFVLFAPLAYVDVSSCWRMNSRWPRMGVSLAGMYVEWVVAAIGVLALSQTQDPVTQHLLHNLIITAGISTLLFNANLLMRFDGYFVLADLVDIPNLYSESSSELKRLTSRFLFGQQVPPTNYVGWRLALLRTYAVAAVAWKLVICVTLSIAAATMFSGAGIILAMIGMVTWFGRPLSQFTAFLHRQFINDSVSCLRGCMLLGVGSLLLIATVFLLPIPSSMHAPAVVRFVPEAVLRSQADGFVSAIEVADSMTVQQGDLLLRLDNPDLQQRLATLEIESQKSRIQQRGAQQTGDAALAQVLQQRLDSLRTQIASVQTQVDALTVVASRDGVIHARHLDRLLGSFVEQGDVLMTIASADEKEIVAMVHQDQITVARQSVGNQVPMRTPAFETLDGNLHLVEPRAQFQLQSPSLSATNGGPLAVRADETTVDENGHQTFRLIEPHFASRINIDPQTARSLPAGLRLQASIGYRTDPIATRMGITIAKLWHLSQDAASQR